MRRRLPTWFVSHGGGPWPFLQGRFRRQFDRLEASLLEMRRELGRSPAAVLVVTAHWEAPRFTVSAHPNPPMLYDYSGFPAETYHVQYPAPGEPQLAQRVAELLRSAGVAAELDTGRGFDHGTFSILVPLFPKAEVPVVQLSLHQDLDPQAHLAAGRALAALRDEEVLIIGSGLSYHNLSAFGPIAHEPSRAWLPVSASVRSPDPHCAAGGLDAERSSARRPRRAHGNAVVCRRPRVMLPTG